eukprot:scaffold24.g2953.t1
MEADIPALVAQLGSSDAAAQQAAAEELGKLVQGSPSNQEAIAASGALPFLVAAAEAVDDLAADCPSNMEAIAAAGAFPRLVRMLGSTNEGVQLVAAQALSGMSYDSPSHRMAIAAAGAIPPLVRLLGSSDAEAQHAAAWALGLLIDNCTANQAAIAAAGAIPRLLRMLDSTDEDNEAQAGASFALAALAQSAPLLQQPQQPAGGVGVAGVASAAGSGTVEAAARDALVCELLCPITQEPMRDPVLTADGRTYECAAIEAWIAQQLGKGCAPASPITGDLRLVPNQIVRGLTASAAAMGLLR